MADEAAESGHALHAARWLLVAAAVSLLALPVGATLVAPHLASVPVVAAAAPERVTTGSGRKVRLDGLVDTLPIVVGGFPDAVSNEAVTDWRRARLLDPITLVRMFDHAWQGLTVQAGADGAVAALRHWLLYSYDSNVST